MVLLLSKEEGSIGAVSHSSVVAGGDLGKCCCSLPRSVRAQGTERFPSANNRTKINCKSTGVL